VVERVDPAFGLGDREMLESWLEFHRATLLMKCAGLSRDQLATRSVPPSSLSLLGLVRHMADVERNWFRRVLAGEPAPGIYWSDDNEDGDFNDIDAADDAEAFATLANECDHARSVAAEFGSLDDVGTGLRQGEPVSLRWIYVHMIEEYARHNGHADLLRERIDGVTGD
jgi:uncharacterized damage-inducible protein DinB